MVPDDSCPGILILYDLFLLTVGQPYWLAFKKQYVVKVMAYNFWG